MRGDPVDPSHQQGQARLRNLTVVGIAGLAGFSTVVLVIAALLLGMWIDSLVGVRGPFMILLVVLSVPLSLFVMLHIVLSATRAIRSPEQTGPLSETTLPNDSAAADRSSVGSIKNPSNATKED